MISTPKIVRLFHHTGELYEAFRNFSSNHPHASWFQSEHFYSFARCWPEAEPVLLVALKGQQLRDPGKRYSRPADKNIISQEKETGVATGNIIAGSLLAVIIREPVPRKYSFWPLKGIYSGLTSRTVVYGGPLLSEGTRLEKELAFKELIDGLQDNVRAHSLFTQFRNLFDISAYKPIFYDRGFKYHDHLNLVVDTSSYEKAWMGMSNSRRRQVKKSLNNGAVVIENPSPGQIDQFYDLLSELYTKRVRKPLPSREFFHLLLEGNVVEKKDKTEKKSKGDNTPWTSKTILISYQDKIIGGIACPLMPSRVLYEWYVCGLDKKYKEKEIYPSVLATWSALRHAYMSGIPQFDFMGTGVPFESYGVRDFKERFGGTSTNYGRFSKVNKKFRYLAAELFYNIFHLRKSN